MGINVAKHLKDAKTDETWKAVKTSSSNDNLNFLLVHA